MSEVDPTSEATGTPLPFEALQAAPGTRNIRLTIAYDGTDYSGWQVQPSRPSVQASVEQAILKITGEQRRLYCAGRTDAGVHAVGQVAAFTADVRVPLERLAQATFDVSEYVVDIAKKEGLAPGLEPIEGGISLHLACHARAQNMGPKAAEMLRLAPKTRVAVIERCSGHGGIWGARVENFDIAVKVGKPAAQAALKMVDLQLSYTTVVVPADGIITQLSARQGALIQAGQPIAQLAGRERVSGLIKRAE